MPTISRFFGIAIRMYYEDHGRPHFHAYYGGYEAVVLIESVKILEGYLTRRAESLVLSWARQHQRRLLENWTLARQHEPLILIEPLD